MSALVKENDDLLTTELVRMAMEATEYSSAAAVDWALGWIRSNPAWRAAHEEEIIRAWLVVRVGMVTKNERQACAEERQGGGYSTANVTPFKSALTEAVNANYSRMIDSPIWGGKRIGDATPEEIRESARQFDLHGKSMIRKARWQVAVADAAEANGAGVNEPVRSALTPKTFEQLWEEADVA